MSTHDNRTPLPVGARVRSIGQQYPDAIRLGTATIVRVIKQHAVDGTWEYEVLTDGGETRHWNIVDTPLPAETRGSARQEDQP